MVFAQSRSKAPPAKILPMEVELVHSLSSGGLHVGDEVLGKLRADWTDGICHLAEASVVHGEVKKVSDASSRHGEIALEFRYGCRELDPQRLVWIALLAPDPNAVDPSGHAVMRQLFRSPSFGEGGGLGSAGNTQSNHVDMAGRQNATMPLSFEEGESDRKRTRPEAVKTGEVWKLPRRKLEVGSGPDGSTVLLSTDRQATLPAGAVLILLPESVAVVRPVEDVSASVATVAAPKVIKASLPAPMAACVEPWCHRVMLSEARAAEAMPQQRISLEGLGYRRLKAAEMQDLEFGAAVAYLGSDHLLFTFNPHTLVERTKDDAPEDRPHMVRAVLLNVVTGVAERTLEWRVANDAQYLWILGGERVLVHDGDRLCWLDGSLREEHSFELGGRLAFLRISPDRKHYAIGVIRELHTRQEHAELTRSDANGPEERVVIHMLDEKLEPVSEGIAGSRAMPQLLLDSGRVELRRTQGSQYYLREYLWNSGEHHDFARIGSSCVPKLNSVSVGLITVEGCDGLNLDHFFRVIRTGGDPVLEGVVHWREFSPLAAGGGGVFALTVPEGGDGYVRERSFHGADLSRETVGVYRASDGHELMEVKLRLASPTRQPVAFSPGGSRMAVLDGEEICIYAVPPAAGP